MMKNQRVGIGFDSHLFSKKGPLILGGVSIPGTPALKGHSDGDALLHAVIDALLGGSGLGDIGEYFSDKDPRWRGASSAEMLKKVIARVLKKGLKPVNVDLIVLADKPRFSNLKRKIKKKLAALLSLSESRVNLKAKTQEGLILFKRPGGIAVWAAVSLQKK